MNANMLSNKSIKDSRKMRKIRDSASLFYIKKYEQAFFFIRISNNNNNQNNPKNCTYNF